MFGTEAWRRLFGFAASLVACLIAATPAPVDDPPETPGPPETPSFGPDIEPYGTYDGQKACDPAEKPGVR